MELMQNQVLQRYATRGNVTLCAAPPVVAMHRSARHCPSAQFNATSLPYSATPLPPRVAPLCRAVRRDSHQRNGFTTILSPRCAAHGNASRLDASLVVVSPGVSMPFDAPQRKVHHEQ